MGRTATDVNSDGVAEILAPVSVGANAVTFLMAAYRDGALRTADLPDGAPLRVYEGGGATAVNGYGCPADHDGRTLSVVEARLRDGSTTLFDGRTTTYVVDRGRATAVHVGDIGGVAAGDPALARPRFLPSAVQRPRRRTLEHMGPDNRWGPSDVVAGLVMLPSGTGLVQFPLPDPDVIANIADSGTLWIWGQAPDGTGAVGIGVPGVRLGTLGLVQRERSADRQCPAVRDASQGAAASRSGWLGPVMGMTA